MHSLAVQKGPTWLCHLQRGGEGFAWLEGIFQVVILSQSQCQPFKVLNSQKHGGFITKEKNLFFTYFVTEQFN